MPPGCVDQRQAAPEWLLQEAGYCLSGGIEIYTASYRVHNIDNPGMQIGISGNIAFKNSFGVAGRAFDFRVGGKFDCTDQPGIGIRKHPAFLMDLDHGIKILSILGFSCKSCTFEAYVTYQLTMGLR